MKKLLVVYHSQTGNTEAMAKAIAEGATSAGASVTLKQAAGASGDDLLGCEGAAIGTPNYFSNMSGITKDFFDRVWPVCRGKVSGKPYVAFSSGGSSGRGALESVERICSSSLGMNKAFDGIVASGKPSAKIFDDCKELGKKLAQL